MRRFSLTVFLIIGMISPAGHAGIPLAEMTTDEFVKNFILLTTKAEISENPNDQRVHKWVAPIRYAVIGAPSRRHYEIIDHAMAEVEKLVSVPISASRVPIAHSTPYKEADTKFVLDNGTLGEQFHLSYSGKLNPPQMYLLHGYGDNIMVWRANFLVIWANKNSAIWLSGLFKNSVPQLEKDFRSDKAKCSVVTMHSLTTSAINYVVAILRTDVDEFLLRRCANEEITQGFGIGNDIKGSPITLFNDDYTNKNADLTVFDKEVLRVLYNPKIKPGMSPEQVRDILPSIILN